MQAYSDPKREGDPYALPDIEVWEHTTFEGDKAEECPRGDDHTPFEPHGPECDGWYWWPVSPGCLPDGPAIGPFKSQAEALADAQEEATND